MLSTRSIFASALLACLACSGSEKNTGKTAAGPLSAQTREQDPGDGLPQVELATDPDAELPFDSRITHGELENGLAYYILPNKVPAKSLELWLVVDAGSYQEDDDQRGLAHFVEHMAFNGTAAFPKNELTSKLQSLGAKFGPHINASTSFDETQYKLRLPTSEPGNVDLGLSILKEWATAVTFLKEDVDAERGVVLSEKRSGEGAQMRMTQSVIELVFKGTRYAQRLPIGKPEILKNATPETLKRYYRDWYHPANFAVIAVGDIEVASLEDKIRTTFGDIPRKESPREPEPRKLPQHTELTYLAKKDAELPVAAVAFGRLSRMEDPGTVGAYRKLLRRTLIGAMLGERLSEAREKGNASYLAAGAMPVPLVRGVLAKAAFAVVDPKKPRASVEDFVAELERARRYGFTSGELERTRKAILAAIRSSAREYQAGKERSSGLAAELARHHLTGEGMPGRVYELRLQEQILGSLDPKNLGADLAELLRPEGLIALSVGESATSTLQSRDFEEILAGVPALALEPYVDAPSGQALVSTPPAAGTVVAERKIPSIDVTEWKLSNGARVLLKPTDFKKDQVLLMATSPGGSSLVDADKLPRVAKAAQLTQLGGLGEFDATQLRRMLAGRDATARAWIGRWEEGMRASSGNKDVETLLQLVHLRFRKPRKDPEAFAIWRDATAKQVRLSANRPEERFARRLASLRSKGNPRFFNLTAERIEALDLEASFQLYKERFRDASDFTFVLVGNFSLSEIKPLVLRYIGSIPDEDRSEGGIVHPFPLDKKTRRLELRDGSAPRAQLSIRLEKDLEGAALRRDERSAWAMAGEAIELRFLDLFREELGATYSVRVSSGLTRRRTRASMHVSFQVEPKRARELEKRALAELKKLQKRGLAADHVDKVIAARRESLLKSQEQNEWWLENLIAAVSYGKPLEKVLSGYSKALESMSKRDLDRALSRFLDLRAPVIGVHLPDKGKAPASR